MISSKSSISAGGQCKLLQRSIKKGCERKELKSFQNMNFTEYKGQWDHPFAIRVRLRKNMRRTVVNAVGLGYLDKYGMSENPCKVTPVIKIKNIHRYYYNDWTPHLSLRSYY